VSLGWTSGAYQFPSVPSHHPSPWGESLLSTCCGVAPPARARLGGIVPTPVGGRMPVEGRVPASAAGCDEIGAESPVADAGLCARAEARLTCCCCCGGRGGGGGGGASSGGYHFPSEASHQPAPSDVSLTLCLPFAGSDPPWVRASPKSADTETPLPFGSHTRCSATTGSFFLRPRRSGSLGSELVEKTGIFGISGFCTHS
jgi:hypothetical protein